MHDMHVCVRVRVHVGVQWTTLCRAYCAGCEDRRRSVTCRAAESKCCPARPLLLLVLLWLLLWLLLLIGRKAALIAPRLVVDVCNSKQAGSLVLFFVSL